MTDPGAAEDRWLSTAAACAVLSVTRWTLDRYVRQGWLHPKRLGAVGGELRWSQRELLSLLKDDPDPDASYRGGGPRGRRPRKATGDDVSANDS